MLSCGVIARPPFFVFGRFIFTEKRVSSCSTRTPFPSCSIFAKIEAAFERNSSNVTGSNGCAIVLHSLAIVKHSYSQGESKNTDVLDQIFSIEVRKNPKTTGRSHLQQG